MSTKMVTITLPTLTPDSTIMYTETCDIDGEKAYSIRETTVAKYAELFKVDIMRNGWPDGMSILDIGVSLRKIDEERGTRYMDDFINAVFV